MKKCLPLLSDSIINNINIAIIIIIIVIIIILIIITIIADVFRIRTDTQLWFMHSVELSPQGESKTLCVEGKVKAKIPTWLCDRKDLEGGSTLEPRG